VILARLPARLIDKGMAEPGLLAHVLIDKYVDHLPVYRQVARLRREGVARSDSTVVGWIEKTAWPLRPLHEALRTAVLESGYVQVDETPIPVQDTHKKGTTHRGYYWVYPAPELKVVVMDYCTGRQRAGTVSGVCGVAGVSEITCNRQPDFRQDEGPVGGLGRALRRVSSHPHTKQKLPLRGTCS